MFKLILPEEKYWVSFLEGVEEFKKFPTDFDTNYIIPSCRKKGLASLGLKKCCKYAKDCS